GEMLELEKKRDLTTSEADYFRMIDEKTATLIAAACEIGGYLTYGDGKERQALHRFGTELGMAFQITDDLLDFVGDSGHIGKSTGADIRDGKITLPLIHALRQAPPEKANAIGEYIRATDITEPAWNAIFDFTAEFGGLDYGRAMAQKYADRAVRALDEFDDSPIKSTLATAVDYVVHRRR
ncbi:MAG TPA: polyprenyl synthetase family protein, partial [Candidatus Eisenbacteria bacterium]